MSFVADVRFDGRRLRIQDSLRYPGTPEQRRADHRHRESGNESYALIRTELRNGRHKPVWPKTLAQLTSQPQRLCFGFLFQIYPIDDFITRGVPSYEFFHHQPNYTNVVHIERYIQRIQFAF